MDTAPSIEIVDELLTQLEWDSTEVTYSWLQTMTKRDGSETHAIKTVGRFDSAEEAEAFRTAHADHFDTTGSPNFTTEFHLIRQTRTRSKVVDLVVGA